jgi:hypothetical protein
MPVSQFAPRLMIMVCPAGRERAAAAGHRVVDGKLLATELSVQNPPWHPCRPARQGIAYCTRSGQNGRALPAHRKLA